MLVLTRIPGEKIHVIVPPSDTPTEVIVLVADIERGKARIGIEAPRNVDIMRNELIPLHQREAVS
jgi:carbon storage regulator